MTVRRRRWLTLFVAPLVAAAFFVAPAGPASADPNDGSATSTTPDEKANGTDDLLLNDVLESSNRRYVQAKAAVAKSTTTQATLAAQIKVAEARRDVLTPEVNAIAAKQYETGNIGPISYLLGSNSSDDFLAKAISLNEINSLHDHTLRDLDNAINEVNTAKAALDAEVKAQQNNLALMQKQKEAADKAFALVGGEALTGGFVLAKSPVAAPAPRDAEGGFAPEQCDIPDPTTDGCITARTLHLYKETKKAGFNRFVSCHRNGGPFEHPKGRACDWSLQNKGFSVAHNADMKNYGNNIMAFFVRNADRLGIYYVIWFREVWFPATGWKAYHGDSEHTDHVHVSLL